MQAETSFSRQIRVNESVLSPYLHFAFSSGFLATSMITKRPGTNILPYHRNKQYFFNSNTICSLYLNIESKICYFSARIIYIGAGLNACGYSLFNLFLQRVIMLCSFPKFYLNTFRTRFCHGYTNILSDIQGIIWTLSDFALRVKKWFLTIIISWTIYQLWWTIN